MNRRNVPIIMLICVLLGLTACEDKVKLAVEDLEEQKIIEEEKNKQSVLGYRQCTNATVNGQKGDLVIDLQSDGKGYVIFNGESSVYFNEVSYYVAGNTVTFSGGSLLNGTYDIGNAILYDLELKRTNQVFRFKNITDVETAILFYKGKIKIDGSTSNYMQWEFSSSTTGVYTRHRSYKDITTINFTYNLDKNKKSLSISYANGTKEDYFYVASTGTNSKYLLMFYKENNSIKYRKLSKY